jgi:hypothetical protein
MATYRGSIQSKHRGAVVTQALKRIWESPHGLMFTMSTGEGYDAGGTAKVPFESPKPADPGAVVVDEVKEQDWDGHKESQLYNSNNSSTHMEQ